MELTVAVLNGRPQFTPEQVRDIRIRLAQGELQEDIAKRYSCKQVSISHIHTGKTYKKVK